MVYKVSSNTIQGACGTTQISTRKSGEAEEGIMVAMGEIGGGGDEGGGGEGGGELGGLHGGGGGKEGGGKEGGLGGDGGKHSFANWK